MQDIRILLIINACFISELEEILDNDIQAMVDNNQLEEAFELTIIYLLK